MLQSWRTGKLADGPLALDAQPALDFLAHFDGQQGYRLGQAASELAIHNI
jgi:hypothetical protein